MIPNYKRPQINDYIFDILERPMTDEDLEMINYLREIEKENKELKKQLEVSNELVAQGTLTEMKLRNEVNSLRKEYQDTYKDVRIEIKEYKTQQKEFINYLEDYINSLKKEYGNYVNDNYSEEYGRYYTAKEILQKYKEIIGDDK